MYETTYYLENIILSYVIHIIIVGFISLLGITIHGIRVIMSEVKEFLKIDFIHRLNCSDICPKLSLGCVMWEECVSFLVVL
jgi:hypothetical protein